MKKKVSKMICLILTLALCFCMAGVNGIDVQAASSITGNNTKATAYNYGRWSSINSNYATVILESGQNESWLQFTLNAGEHIYIRASYDEEYAGEWLEIQDGLGNTVGTPQITPGDVYNQDSVTPGIYLDCDNNSTSTRNYYLVLHRGTVPADVSIYFSVSAYTRLRTHTSTFSVSGTASNPGNSGMNLNGVNSSILTLNLANDDRIPVSAVVRTIRTAGTQSPNQGNVHHMLMPSNSGNWYTSKVSSANSGSYNIDIDDNIPGKQQWSFRYNALATVKSTIKNVKITIDYQYDLHDTNYKLIIN